MNEPPLQPGKPSFQALCQRYQIDDPVLYTIANLAGVSSLVADDMFKGHPVSHVDAEKLLRILSQHVGRILTLDTVDVPIRILQTKGEEQSEVKRLLTEIQQEYESAQQGLTGLAQGTSQHTFITRKMEKMGKLHKELEKIVGDVAIAMICDHLGDTSETPNASSP